MRGGCLLPAVPVSFSAQLHRGGRVRAPAQYLPGVPGAQLRPVRHPHHLQHLLRGLPALLGQRVRADPLRPGLKLPAVQPGRVLSVRLRLHPEPVPGPVLRVHRPQLQLPGVAVRSLFRQQPEPVLPVPVVLRAGPEWELYPDQLPAQLPGVLLLGLLHLLRHRLPAELLGAVPTNLLPAALQLLHPVLPGLQHQHPGGVRGVPAGLHAGQWEQRVLALRVLGPKLPDLPAEPECQQYLPAVCAGVLPELVLPVRALHAPALDPLQCVQLPLLCLFQPVQHVCAWVYGRPGRLRDQSDSELQCHQLSVLRKTGHLCHVCAGLLA